MSGRLESCSPSAMLPPPDITLVAPDSRQLPCHISRLVSMSRSCREIFGSNAAAFVGRLLLIHGVDSAALEHVISSFYTGHCPVTAHQVVAVCDVATRLGVQPLVDASLSFMRDCCNVENCCMPLLQDSVQSGLITGVEICAKFVAQSPERFAQVVASPGFLNCGYDAMMTVLKTAQSKGWKPDNVIAAAAQAWLHNAPKDQRMVVFKQRLVNDLNIMIPEGGQASSPHCVTAVDQKHVEQMLSSGHKLGLGNMWNTRLPATAPVVVGGLHQQQQHNLVVNAGGFQLFPGTNINNPSGDAMFTLEPNNCLNTQQLGPTSANGLLLVQLPQSMSHGNCGVNPPSPAGQWLMMGSGNSHGGHLPTNVPQPILNQTQNANNFFPSTFMALQMIEAQLRAHQQGGDMTNPPTSAGELNPLLQAAAQQGLDHPNTELQPPPSSLNDAVQCAVGSSLPSSSPGTGTTNGEAGFNSPETLHASVGGKKPGEKDERTGLGSGFDGAKPEESIEVSKPTEVGKCIPGHPRLSLMLKRKMNSVSASAMEGNNKASKSSSPQDTEAAGLISGSVANLDSGNNKSGINDSFVNNNSGNNNSGNNNSGNHTSNEGGKDSYQHEHVPQQTPERVHQLLNDVRHQHQQLKPWINMSRASNLPMSSDSTTVGVGAGALRGAGQPAAKHPEKSPAVGKPSKRQRTAKCSSSGSLDGYRRSISSDCSQMSQLSHPSRQFDSSHGQENKSKSKMSGSGSGSNDDWQEQDRAAAGNNSKNAQGSDPNIDAAHGSSRKPWSNGQTTKPIKCCIPGCDVDIQDKGEYYLRYKMCAEHLKSSAITFKDGTIMRFCQQCGNLHSLAEFDGSKRSCRVMLQKRSLRRKERASKK